MKSKKSPVLQDVVHTTAFKARTKEEAFIAGRNEGFNMGTKEAQWQMELATKRQLRNARKDAMLDIQQVWATLAETAQYAAQHANQTALLARQLSKMYQTQVEALTKQGD